MSTSFIPCVNLILLLSIFTVAIDPSDSNTFASPLNSVLDIFSHCTLIVKFTTNKEDLIPLHPLLIYVENFMSIPNYAHGNNNFLFKNVPFSRRRQLAKFCWTYVFPDMGVKFLLSNLANSPIFPGITGSAYPIQIIWLISTDQEMAYQEMQTIHAKILLYGITSWGSREFYFAQPGLKIKTKMQFYHLNLYYRQGAALPTLIPTSVLTKFELFSQIRCDLKFKMECYQSIEDATDKVTTAFNKFSWVYVMWLDDYHLSYIFSETFAEMQKKYFQYKQSQDWIEIAKQSESLDDFISYTIFSESLNNITFPMKVYDKNTHIFFGKGRMRYCAGNHQIVFIGSQSYSFLSCYGIRKENSYKIFTDPFDKYTWICIFIVILVFSSISGLIIWRIRACDYNGLLHFDVSIVTVAVILEISLTSNIKKVVPVQIEYVFWLWIFCSMILTSFYKNTFTVEVILPYKRSPSWAHIYDLQDQGFQLFLPVKPDVEQFYDWYANGTPIDTFFSFEFSADTIAAADYKGDFPRLLGYKRFADALLASDPETGRGASSGGKNMKRIWRDLHYKWPSHIYPNLSRCEDKLAYIDEKENIKNIIPFLNDNVDGTVFMEGTDDDFLLTHYAIQIDQTPRRNFVLNRAKFLMVSGIYNWWEKWFIRTRPKKLFPYYANWTWPNIGALERLDFGSKFATTLRIWGVCCAICCVVRIMESLISCTTYKNNEVRYF
ncbi:hypothetical protein Fcan01_04862 [Folsomia candida]|uniref:Uncharacterized protein n=1 Tax=Folsomia candida TaxID=158441 RepID=A0A226ETM6_FOLCA|nr:hypothetical protein Fcan01_04862 [Folsomia candida]